MLNVIIVVFLALLFYFLLKLVYNIAILVIIGAVFARIKANGSEIMNKFNEERGREDGKEGELHL